MRKTNPAAIPPPLPRPVLKARGAGVLRLDLRVMVQNARAVSLYQRRGFGIEGRVRGEFCVDGKLVDAYVMGKILT